MVGVLERGEISEENIMRLAIRKPGAGAGGEAARWQ